MWTCFLLPSLPCNQTPVSLKWSANCSENYFRYACCDQCSTHTSFIIMSNKGRLPVLGLINAAATGDGLWVLGLRGMGMGTVIEWNEDGSCDLPGPESSHHKAGRAECVAHFLFNTFWGVSHCCGHQLLHGVEDAISPKQNACLYWEITKASCLSLWINCSWRIPCIKCYLPND